MTSASSPWPISSIRPSHSTSIERSSQASISRSPEQSVSIIRGASPAGKVCVDITDPPMYLISGIRPQASGHRSQTSILRLAACALRLATCSLRLAACSLLLDKNLDPLALVQILHLEDPAGRAALDRAHDLLGGCAGGAWEQPRAQLHP